MPEPPDKPTAEDRIPHSDQAPSTMPLSDFERPPERIGPYRILEVIGEGGMGTVYLAEQEAPVRRRVALKIIKLGMDTKEVVARFEAERQALAMMDHPNIAKVFDAGATEQGRPYFVMEHVRGERITDYCDKHKLTTSERLELFIQVCRAIQHAHQKGVIHRDIKPSNVLVTIPDDKPVPKVIDFGVAKATGHRLTEKTIFTEQGQLIGTPEYMSPEQAEMTGLNVDTRTDIYSLGVLLYELLTGTLPFDSITLRKAGLRGIQDTIREEEPPRPSTRISRLGDKAAESANRRRTSVPRLRKQLRHELDWITMRAMEKDRARRYQSASEFAADIERSLHDEAVLASPPSATYRMRKFIKKHRGPVAAVLAVMLTIVVLGAAALWQKQIAEQQKEIAEQRARQASANAVLAHASAAKAPLLKALLVLEVPDLVDPSERMLVAREAASSSIPRLVFRGHRKAIRTGRGRVRYSPDGTRIVTVSADSTVRVWNADGTGAPTILRGHEGGVWDAAFSPDGTRILTVSADSTVRVWRTDGTGDPIILRHETPGTPRRLFNLGDAAFSPDGTRIVTTSADSTVRVWNAEGTGAPTILRGHEGGVWGAEFSPDGTRIVTTSADSTARVWRTDGTGDPIILRHETQVSSAEFSPDGTRVVTNHVRSGTVRVWRSDSVGAPIVLRHTDYVYDVEFSPDGQSVATACLDEAARLWTSDGNGETVVFRGHSSGAYALAFSPDGSELAVGSHDGVLRVWRVRTDTGSVILSVGAITSGAVFSPDGTRIVTASWDRAVRVWAADGTGSPIVLRGHSGAVWNAMFSPDGTRVVSASADSTARVWNADGTGAPTILRGHEGGVWDAAFSPDGTRIVTTSDDSTARVWRTDGTGDPIILRGHGGRVYHAAFNPDGTRVVTTSRDGTARVWEADGTGEYIVLRGHEGYVIDAAFSPDGTRVVTSSEDLTIRVWDGEGGEQILVRRGHEAGVSGVVFSPDGTQILSASRDATFRLWAADGSEEPLIFRGHDKWVYQAHFSPDGSKIVTASRDGTARVWSRLTWESLSDFLREKTTACLTPEERMKFLGETASEAWAGYSRCERRYERAPMASLRPE